MVMVVGERVIVSGTDLDGTGESLLGERGTVTRRVDPDWKYGCNVVVALDCGIDELLFDSELELDVIEPAMIRIIKPPEEIKIQATVE